MRYVYNTIVIILDSMNPFIKRVLRNNKKGYFSSRNNLFIEFAFVKALAITK